MQDSNLWLLKIQILLLFEMTQFHLGWRGFAFMSKPITAFRHKPNTRNGGEDITSSSADRK